MSKIFKGLSDKSPAELQALLKENRELLRDLSFKDANKQLRNVRQLRVVKKTIANIITLLNKKDDHRK
ncbi:MAG: 50S ribosomal protein L29 [Patescibacteria group bacterium]|jgi:ribosomal protein L29